MRPRTRLKWDKFICWLFDHRWIDSTGDDDKYLDGVLVSTWRVCLRCASVKKAFYPPPALPNCQVGFVTGGLMPKPAKKDLEFIEFQKNYTDQINKAFRFKLKGGKDGKNKRD